MEDIGHRFEIDRKVFASSKESVDRSADPVDVTLRKTGL